MPHFPSRHALRRLRKTVAVAVMCVGSASCGPDLVSRSSQASTAAEATRETAVDASRMLSLTQYINDANVGEHGTCLATATRPDRSRLIYLVIPEDTAFIRFNVVTSADGAGIQLIDFLRGLPNGGQWSATQARSHDAVVSRTFASITDHAPRIITFGGDGLEAQRLRELAAAALGLTCPSS